MLPVASLERGVYLDSWGHTQIWLTLCPLMASQMLMIKDPQLAPVSILDLPKRHWSSGPWLEGGWRDRSIRNISDTSLLRTFFWGLPARQDFGRWILDLLKIHHGYFPCSLSHRWAQLPAVKDLGRYFCLPLPCSSQIYCLLYMPDVPGHQCHRVIALLSHLYLKNCKRLPYSPLLLSLVTRPHENIVRQPEWHNYRSL